MESSSTSFRSASRPAIAVSARGVNNCSSSSCSRSFAFAFVLRVDTLVEFFGLITWLDSDSRHTHTQSGETMCGMEMRVGTDDSRDSFRRIRACGGEGDAKGKTSFLCLCCALVSSLRGLIKVRTRTS